MSKLTPESEWLRADVGAARDTAVGVDRTANVIRGYVLAEKGRFKNRNRGEFDDKSLDLIVELAAGAPVKDGLLSRFTHPGLSADGLGTHLGRTKNVRRDGDKVRGDLHLNPTALKVPPKGGRPLGDYLMELAETDAGAFGSSLVLKADKEIRLAADGKSRLKDDTGEPLPPLWRPKVLHASDMVGEGEAVHGNALSADELAGLRDDEVRQGSELFRRMCERNGWNRATAGSCLTGFRDRLLELQFGPDEGEELNDMSTPTEAEAAAATPKPAPAPKPSTTPPPPANPPAAPKPQPKPAPKGSEEEGRGDPTAFSPEQLSALREVISGEFSRRDTDRDAKTAAALSALDAREQAILKRERDDQLAAIDEALAKAAGDGVLTPAEVDEERPFLQSLDGVKPYGKAVVNGREVVTTQLSHQLIKLGNKKPETFGQRIPGGRRDPAAVSQERKDELLGLTPAGRAVIAARVQAGARN